MISDDYDLFRDVHISDLRTYVQLKFHRFLSVGRVGVHIVVNALQV
jgi:hypothetical protein